MNTPVIQPKSRQGAIAFLPLFLYPLSMSSKNPFDTQPLDAEQAAAVEAVRAALKETYTALLTHAPASRERSLAVTHLEEVGMWATKAIAFNGVEKAPKAEDSSSSTGVYGIRFEITVSREDGADLVERGERRKLQDDVGGLLIKELEGKGYSAQSVSYPIDRDGNNPFAKRG